MAVSFFTLLVVSLTSHDVQLLDFQASSCAPCRDMIPTVERLSQAGYPVTRIDVDQEPELARKHGVRKVPCFVLLRENREVVRAEGTVTRETLENMFRQAGYVPVPRRTRVATTAASESNSKQNALATASQTARDRESFPISDGDASFFSRRQTSLASSPRPLADLSLERTFSPASRLVLDDPPLVPVKLKKRPAVIFPREPSLSNRDASVSHPGLTVSDRIAAASVRLHVTDPNGNSVGSGTIIDFGDGEALVATCGHIFRDSQGRGRIEVEVFHPRPSGRLPGSLVGYDLKKDVALIRFQSPAGVIPVSPAASEYRPRVGEVVFNVGCSHGANPTVLRSKINTVNKYLGPANVQVAGQPVQGRSGGGLFSQEGSLIGVCNAADPQDNEGFYASVSNLRELLAHKQSALSSFSIARGNDAEKRPVSR